MRTFRIGVISDTHGLLRPEVFTAFRGVSHIVHAGDVGGDDVIARLREIAPITYVPGNVDDGLGQSIEHVTVGGLRILLTHILPRPYERGAHVVRALEREATDFVIFGHSHLPHDEVFEGVRYFNPASAGPRRFDYPLSVGIIEKQKQGWIAWHVPLDDRSVEALRKRMNQLSSGF